MRIFFVAAVICSSSAAFAAVEQQKLESLAKQYTECGPPEAAVGLVAKIVESDLRRTLKYGGQAHPVRIEEAYRVQWSMAPTFIVPRLIRHFATMTLEKASEETFASDKEIYIQWIKKVGEATGTPTVETKISQDDWQMYSAQRPTIGGPLLGVTLLISEKNRTFALFDFANANEYQGLYDAFLGMRGYFIKNVAGCVIRSTNGKLPIATSNSLVNTDATRPLP